MSSIKNIIIIGASGAGKEVADTIEAINLKEIRWNLLGFLDDTEELQNKTINGYPVLGKLPDYIQYPDAYFVFTIGNPKNYIIKKDLINKFKLPDEKFATLIHPDSNVSRSVKIGYGSVILSGIHIGPNVTIGKHVFLHGHSFIAHDTMIGDYSIITNSVSIAGVVSIKENVYIGANASLRDYVTIGRMSQVGMGSVVLHDVDDYQVVVGNPSRFLRNVKEK